MEKFKPNYLNVYVTVLLIIILANLKCCSTRSVFSMKSIKKYIQKDIAEREARVANNNSYIMHSYSPNKQPITKPKPIHIEETSLWPLETRTRKHFEVYNMQWRKTKLFLDSTDLTIFHMQTPSWNFNNLTTKLLTVTPNQHTIKIFSTRPRTVTTTTPSEIEFYYLNDEYKVHDKEVKCSFGSKCMNEKMKFRNLRMGKPSNSSFHVFRVRGGPLHDAIKEARAVPAKQFNNNLLLDKSATNYQSTFLVAITSPTSLEQNGFEKQSIITSTVPSVTNPTTDSIRIYFTQMFTKSPNKTQNMPTKIYHERFKTFDTKTTVNDKIKFFEMYDSMTPITVSKWKPAEFDEYFVVDTLNERQYKTQNVQNIHLNNVDQSGHEHNQSKHSKKHIRKDQQSNILSTELPKVEKRLWKNEIVELKNEIKATTSVQSTSEESNKFKVTYNYFNKTVEWSEYPFAAVYIYEPSKIHCDAAAISPHWLIASGACLSRLNKNPHGQGRSAFVAYCGVEWWKPERISYVKYSLVHPSFHPTEKPRKYLYNIGLVQVVTSMMSACSGWSPVTMMSHQFATAQGGTLASALGWGLDRFDSRYASINLRRSPLTLYNALLFSNSCPGNLASSDAITFESSGVNKNVYCLALPPYFGEDTDPVHGGLLLVGSNLIALYLKEERRSWGEQSAQYTGIWRLIPWITEVAKETEDIDSSYIEI